MMLKRDVSPKEAFQWTASRIARRRSPGFAAPGQNPRDACQPRPRAARANSGAATEVIRRVRVTRGHRAETPTLGFLVALPVNAAVTGGRGGGRARVPGAARRARGLAAPSCDTRAVPSETDRRRVDEVPRLLAYPITTAREAFLQRSRLERRRGVASARGSARDDARASQQRAGRRKGLDADVRRRRWRGDRGFEAL